MRFGIKAYLKLPTLTVLRREGPHKNAGSTISEAEALRASTWRFMGRYRCVTSPLAQGLGLQGFRVLSGAISSLIKPSRAPCRALALGVHAPK